MAPKNLPRKALIAVSSFNGAIYPDGHKTGVFFVEALHPYEVLTAAGFEVDLASETGTCAFDDISLTPPFLSGTQRKKLSGHKRGAAPCGTWGTPWTDRRLWRTSPLPEGWSMRTSPMT